MKKKKKIIIILLFIVTFCTIICANIKTHADYVPESPDPYNIIFTVTEQESTVDFVVNVSYYWGPTETLSGVVADIDLNESEWNNFGGYFIVNEIYIGHGYLTQVGSSYTLFLDSPFWCIPLNDYLNSISESSQNYYRTLLQQKDQQIEDITNSYNSYISEIESNYDNIISQKDSTILQLTESLNSAKPSWGSFTGLLGTVFLFPIRFFKEGFNIQLFGVNIGSLIVGVGILGIAISVIVIVLHGRSKKDE